MKFGRGNVRLGVFEGRATVKRAVDKGDTQVWKRLLESYPVALFQNNYLSIAFERFWLFS